MLKNTFCHLPGVGAKTEVRLWESGVESWEVFVSKERLPLTLQKQRMLTPLIRESLHQLQEKNPRYFAQTLASKELWRLFPEFRNTIAYFDIETTGLSAWSDQITTIALYNGKEIFTYVQGKNLDRFPEDIKNYSLLVSYNGKGFDVPFIEKYFGITIPQAHIDLMHVLHSLGIKGGLKGCERKLGIDRGELEGVDGYFAVQLWREYQKNQNPQALETLIAYNIEDVVNLETLMVKAFNLKLQETPFEKDYKLPLPQRPEIPYQAHAPTIQKLLHQSQSYW